MKKVTYTDGQYFCNACDSPHEGEELAVACYDECRKPGRYRVIYTVKFECDVVIEPGDDFQDAISDIDIPEGGQNNSVYCEGTFKIDDYVHSDEV